jgi:hypothetical protein
MWQAILAAASTTYHGRCSESTAARHVRLRAVQVTRGSNPRFADLVVQISNSAPAPASTPPCPPSHPGSTASEPVSRAASSRLSEFLSQKSTDHNLAPKPVSIPAAGRTCTLPPHLRSRGWRRGHTVRAAPERIYLLLGRHSYQTTWGEVPLDPLCLAKRNPYLASLWASPCGALSDRPLNCWQLTTDRQALGETGGNLSFGMTFSTASEQDDE